MWATSCASTASISSGVIPCNKPVDTATSDEFLNAPVAKALGAPSNIPTSGIPIPALSASLRTVSTIHVSSLFWGSLITRTPELHFAIGLLISSEINAPPKPRRSEKPSKAGKFSPLAVKKRLTPSKLAIMPNTATMATLVSTNKKMRFMKSFKR